jgi:hypothetical protein
MRERVGSRGQTIPLLLAKSSVPFFFHHSSFEIRSSRTPIAGSSNSNRTARSRIYRSMNLPSHATLRMEQELLGACCMYWGKCVDGYAACKAAKFGRSQLKSLAETGPIFVCEGRARLSQRERGVQYEPSGNFAKCARKTGFPVHRNQTGILEARVRRPTLPCPLLLKITRLWRTLGHCCMRALCTCIISSYTELAPSTFTSNASF